MMITKKIVIFFMFLVIPLREINAAPLKTRLPILVVGADAFDLKVAEPLLRAGLLPNIKLLFERGVHGVLLSEAPMRSPALWTTMATGKSRTEHGIYDFVTGSKLWPTGLQNTEKKLVTSDMRKVPALWNWTTEHNIKTVVVGWLTTWPAEKIDGVMVSPRVAIGNIKKIDGKKVSYRENDGLVYPASEWNNLRKLIVSPSEITDDELSQFCALPDSKTKKMYPEIERSVESLRWSLARTKTMAALTLRLIKTKQPALTMVYFNGCDGLAHRFWVFRESVSDIRDRLQHLGYPVKDAALMKKMFGGVVDKYYQYLDKKLGELLRIVPKDTRILMVSDHGFTDLKGRFIKRAPFTGRHRIEGTIIAAGPGITPGKKVTGATLYDIAPTILDWLQLSIDTKFQGHPLFPNKEKFSSTTKKYRESRQVIHYTTDEETRRIEIERLKSLGYIQ